MRRIYLVEDERALCTLLEKYLVHEGYSVRSFYDGSAAMAAIGEAPDLWILDINLPGCSGYDLIRAIKATHPKLPVIFMSARNEELDRVIGLELGSDDYLAKPFLPRELVIRTKNLLERVYGGCSQPDDGEHPAPIVVGTYAIYIEERVVTRSGETIQLTTKEFDLLLYFIAHTHKVIKREQILLAVWGVDYFGSDRVVDDTVRRLRKKMPEAPLETVYGYGYKWGRTL